MNTQPTDHPITEPIPGSVPTQRPENSEQGALDEEGVDASEYVRQLIARGETGARTAATPSAAKQAGGKAQRSPSTAPANAASVSPITDDRTWLDELLSPATDAMEGKPHSNRAKPEQSVDLNELRVAANMMASCALDEFDCKGLVERAYTQLGLAVFSMVMSLILLTMSDSVKSVAFGTTLGTLFLAGVSTYRCAATTRSLIRKVRSQR